MMVFPLIFFFLICLSRPSTAIDTLSPGQTLLDNGQTIVSASQTFELGFFSPWNSENRYVGIWFKNVQQQTPLWVANKNSPLGDSSGVLVINSSGNIIISNNATNTIIWSSNSSYSAATSNPVLQLLDNGNLVVKTNVLGDSYLWQSFDHPCDTLLPGMKLGWNLRSNQEWYLTSWRTLQDPSSGDYTYRVDPRGLPQLVLRQGAQVQYRSGPWDGLRFGGGPELGKNAVYDPMFVSDSNNVYYSFVNNDNSIVSRFVVNQSGALNHLTWNERQNEWIVIITLRADLCDRYALCGPYGFCNVDRQPVCQCPDGFTPRLPEDWARLDWSGGCVRKTPLNCNVAPGFRRFPRSKLPDTAYFLVNRTEMSLVECREACLRNCSCVAYARTENSGCVAWLGGLLDVRDYSEGGQDLYIRMAASDLALAAQGQENPSGELPTGQEVAVKKLSKDSGQGLREFKTEVILYLKLQHRNLVRLLGCCINGEERMLVYEYMPNRSLELMIFNQTRGTSLDWGKRFNIIVGIARGLLYLHRDSRLRIIHRDLKASNILLDSEMNPKISDFGLAKTFGGDQSADNTNRIVGTYGYMSPEYAIDGLFSVKSDVFSFGVLVLEIVRGQKNRGFYHPDHDLNLLGHAWRVWNEGKPLELVDALMESLAPTAEILKCIQTGLLCVQQRPEDRPTMSFVLLLLDSENPMLPQPKQPGFYTERFLPDPDSSSTGKKRFSSSNDLTILVAQILVAQILMQREAVDEEIPGAVLHFLVDLERKTK
ncbi:hypothetical protein RJ640_017560 [Escallonia rubra]|uniref:Receptor-like serine/threonine-protein kinase n=1 Tax=Escallonia rubra TaxID=112253 RepID=A0AA88UTH5_9ASTE|nr:hypothetical protein RJ640_017560 [Escallonia rubra]